MIRLGAFLFALILFGAALGGLFVYFPAKTQDLLENAGLNELEPPMRDGLSLVYQTLKLDPDGFNTIERLVLTPSFRGLKANIKGLRLTGEITPDGHISLENQNFIKPLLALQSLKIRDAHLELLTDAGGIVLETKLHGERNKTNLTLRGPITSTQQHLKLIGQIQARLTRYGWNISLPLEQIRFDTEKIKLIRGNGKLSWHGQWADQNSSTLLGELSAGQIALSDMPWQSASLTFERRAGQSALFLTGKAVGEEHIELTLNADYKNGWQAQGYLHGQNIPTYIKDFWPENLTHNKDIQSLPFAFNAKIFRLKIEDEVFDQNF